MLSVGVTECGAGNVWKQKATENLSCWMENYSVVIVVLKFLLLLFFRNKDV